MRMPFYTISGSNFRRVAHAIITVRRLKRSLYRLWSEIHSGNVEIAK